MERMVLFFVGFIVIALVVIIAVLYLRNLQNLLKQIDPSRRLVPPSNVWLMLIPLFNIVYPFILYPKICDSVKAEFEYRGLHEDGDYGRKIGVALPILGLCGVVPFIGFLAGMANFVLFIIFWVKMSGYKATLVNSPATGDSNSVGSSSDLLDG